MDPGIQAVTARIAQLQQRFDPAAASAAAPTGADSISSAVFSSVLSSALGSTALGAGVLNGDAGSFGLASGAPGLSATGGAGGLSTAAILDLLVRSGRQGVTDGATPPGGAIGAVAGTGARTPATRLEPGRYPRLAPPAELAGYGNGRIPSDRLTSIGVGSHKLYAPAAAAYRAMTADAAAQGVDIGITDSYRSFESQVELAGRKGLYSQGGLAATPGTSNHGWGLAVDLDLDPSAQQWMRDNGWRYGFVEDTPREPWHWAYRPQSA
ncbi:MAG: M15 family metallopeptidase [Actinomycetota bacterium]|nr:M15 family metallopeptidase [Actinomycetota bacterium]